MVDGGHGFVLAVASVRFAVASAAADPPMARTSAVLKTDERSVAIARS